MAYYLSTHRRLHRSIPAMTIEEDERSALLHRFIQEGLDPGMPDNKKLPFVWRWLSDAESNCISLRKQIEKLYRQQEMDIREVEEYVEHVWQSTSDRIRSLEGENQAMKAGMEAHKKSCNLERMNGCRGSNLPDLHKAKPAFKSLFKMPKTSNQQTPHPLSSIEVSLTPQDSTSSRAVNRCTSCVHIVSESKELIHDLESTITELKKENHILTIKLSEMGKIFNRFRKERSDLTQGVKSSGSRQKTEQQQQPGGGSRSDVRREADTGGNDRLDSLEGSKHESVQESNMSSDVAASVSDSGNGSHASASEASSQANIVRDREIDQQIPTATGGRDSSRDNLIQDLRTQVKKLRRELQMRETEYEDLLRKYELMKAKYKDSISDMRERIEQNNAKWQRLFQAANGRKRQALQELDKFTKNRLLTG